MESRACKPGSETGCQRDWQSYFPFETEERDHEEDGSRDNPPEGTAGVVSYDDLIGGVF